MLTKVMVQRFKGQVHCPICTHNVEAEIEQIARKIRVSPGQKCPRCLSTLDVAAVIEVREAA
jgi:hypothetical protein